MNVTNCANGTLQFAPEVTVGGACPAVAAAPASGTVKHAKSWVACPPTALCGIATGIANVYACPLGYLCGGPGTFQPAATLADCATACAGSPFMNFCESCLENKCRCFTQPDGFYVLFTEYIQGYALDVPRSPPDAGCGDGGRRLEAEEGSA